MNLLCMALAFLLIQSAELPPQTASISGIVVEAGTGKPIANATIQAIAKPSAPNLPPMPYTAKSSHDGTFSLTNLKPGDGLLGAMASGYVSAVYVGSGTGRMVWAANQKFTNIRIELMPAGTIAGRIVNQQGEPMANTAVQAVRLSNQNGKRTWRVVESRPTNELGEYRLFWLDPGRYFIRTVQGDTVETSISTEMRQLSINEKLDIQPPALIRRLESDGTFSDEAVLPIYYPGTPEAAQAVPVEIRPGLTARIDFQSSRVPVHRVRGRITGGSVEGGGGSTVRLVPINSNGTQESFPNDYLDLEGLIDGNGFEVSGAPSGSYAVLADLHRDGMSMSARTTIEVRDADVNDLVVAPTPNVRISGSFLIDGNNNDGKSPSAFAQLQLRLRSKTSDADSIESSLINSVLTFDNVPAGDYVMDSLYVWLQIPGKAGSSPAYIESIRAGGQDVLQSGLHVDSGFDQPLRIVVRTDFGSVSGRVTGASPQFPGPVVMLVPGIRNDRARYNMTGVDAAGEFHFKDVAPGDYKLFAPGVNDYNDYNLWQDPEFVAKHEAYGRDIRVTAGNDQTIDVPFISEEPK
jgi:hypothetical protein